MKLNGWVRVLAVVFFSGALFGGSAAESASITGSVRFTDGSNNLLDTTFTESVDPVAISEFVAIPGINTILGIGNVSGTETGHFHLDTFGQEVFEHESLFLFSDVVENTSATAQAFTMDFNINAGMLENTVYESPLNPPGTSGEFLESGYEAVIRINGTQAFFSRAVLRNTGTNGSLSKSGVDLMGTVSNTGSAPSMSTYAWANFLGMLDLGILAPGGMVTIDYEMRAFASGNFDSCGSRGCGSAFASIGDPINLSSIGGPDTISSTPAGPGPGPGVPEPFTLVLIGAGLLLMPRRRGAKAPSRG